MANHSDDEWSLVSDNDEVLSDLSYDEVDPEPEIQVESDPASTVSKTEACVATGDEVEVSNVEGESAAVFSLLSDTSTSERSAAGYSRQIRVSLFSPAHQNWLVGSSPRCFSAPSMVVSPKHDIKLAFFGSEIRSKSFPERLRAITVTKRPLPTPPKFTEVTPFKQDQSTQTDMEVTAADELESRATLLRDALDRSMTMANQLRVKSQDNERLSFRIAELESVADQAEQKSRRHELKIKMNERRLALAKQQAKLIAEYQDNLKTISESLRRENAQLGGAAQNATLRGEDEALAARSLDELEELETMLISGMENVRAAIRTMYRAAMQKRHEKEVCVVCFEKPVAVVLLPCRHQLLCESCALRVTVCPIDRQDIHDKVLTYGLNAYTDYDN